MKVLVLGSGGREHALAESFVRSGHQVFCHPGNPGMLDVSEPLTDHEVRLSDFDPMCALVREKGIDLTVAGSEEPLSLGIADHFAKEGLFLFGPTKKGAQMESSKSWSKAFMQRHQVPTAEFFLCRGEEEAKEKLRFFFLNGKQAVVKPSGLTAGKGIVCCSCLEEGDQAIASSLQYGEEVVIEERLVGREVSILALCDGKIMVPLLPAQDHKRLYNGAIGPNTGGMGAIAPVDWVSEELLQEIEATVIEPTLQGLLAEGIDYRGVLYFGLMITNKGPKVLEYNCRFGDPEAQVVIPLLKGDLAALMLDCIHGNLKRAQVEFLPLSACCVILSSKGYPTDSQIGFEIVGLDSLQRQESLFAFHAGVSRNESQQLVTSGGRVLGVTGLGKSLEEAIDRAYFGVKQLYFEGVHFRTDVGKESCC